MWYFCYGPTFNYEYQIDYQLSGYFGVRLNQNLIKI